MSELARIVTPTRPGICNLMGHAFAELIWQGPTVQIRAMTSQVQKPLDATKMGPY